MNLFLEANSTSEHAGPASRFRWWRDISIYALTGAAVLALLVVVWSARSEVQNLVEYQHSLMENEGRSVSEGIRSFVTERSRLLKLFASQNAPLFTRFVEEGEFGPSRQMVEQSIEGHFPNYFAFTIRLSDGQLVPDDFGEFVGGICRNDLEAFSLHDFEDNIPYLPFIHPQSGNYHFDTMSHLHLTNGQQATLFVSFHPTQLTRIIASYELPGHRVVIVRKDSPDLIELTARGARDQLGENVRLGKKELARIVHRLPIEQTRWVTVVMAQAGFMEALTAKVYRRAGFLALGIVLFWLGAMWLLMRALHQKQRAYATIEDQTERLLSSQHVAHVGSWDWNIVTGELTWTDEIYAIFGRVRKDFTPTYEHFLECVHPEDRDLVVTGVSEAVERNKPYDIEHRVVLPDGSTGYVHQQGKVYHNAQGEPVRMLGVVHDITTRTILDMSKSEFIATVSHELRTPLTSINGSLGLLFGGAAGDLPGPARDMLGVAHRNVERLIALVNDILDIEKLESGKMEFHFENYNLAGVVAEGVKANAGLAEKRQVILRLASSLPHVTVRIDRARVIQVITNLLSNAIKFSEPHDMVEVFVTCSDTMATVHVSDQGPGIPENFQSHIFERFTQVDASDQRSKSGTGLGLSICKSIVEEHDGTIRVVSMMGKGSTFSFTIPIVN